MNEPKLVDFLGRKAMRVGETANGRCLLLYHDKEKNTFRIGMFAIVDQGYRALASDHREITDADPLAESAKKLAQELGEEFKGATSPPPAPPAKVKKQSKAAPKSSKRSPVTVRRI